MRNLCCLALIAECFGQSLLLATSYWHTALHRRNAFTMICFVISLALDLGHYHDGEQPSALRMAVATLAHMLLLPASCGYTTAASEADGGAAASHLRVPRVVAAHRCSCRTRGSFLLDHKHAAARPSFSMTPAVSTLLPVMTSRWLIMVSAESSCSAEVEAHSTYRTAQHRTPSGFFYPVCNACLLFGDSPHLTCWRFESQRHRRATMHLLTL